MALWPAAPCAALKGRTHGCTDQCCKREESSCQLGAVHTWHIADNRGTATFCPLLDKSGQRSAQALNAPVVNDPISDTGWGAIGSAATGVIRAELLVLNRRH